MLDFEEGGEGCRYGALGCHCCYCLLVNRVTFKVVRNAGVKVCEVQAGDEAYQIIYIGGCGAHGLEVSVEVEIACGLRNRGEVPRHGRRAMRSFRGLKTDSHLNDTCST